MKEILGQKYIFMTIFNMMIFKKYIDFVLFSSKVLKTLYCILQFSNVLKNHFNMQAPASIKLVTQTTITGKKLQQLFGSQAVSPDFLQINFLEMLLEIHHSAF